MAAWSVPHVDGDPGIAGAAAVFVVVVDSNG
jgi:hypothetical protein